MDGEGERLRAVAVQVGGGARNDDRSVWHIPVDGARSDWGSHLYGEGGRVFLRSELVGAADAKDTVRRNAAHAGGEKGWMVMNRWR